MFYSPQPTDWKDLQSSVAETLKAIGFEVEIEKNIITPRGSVEIDVWAQDNSGNEPITYLIECKNWNKKIPQTVVHSLTTVMHETGANVGYLISKKGIQSGAEGYLQKTNIKALSYSEFESLYFSSWWGCFMNLLSGSYVDRLLQYTEPINSFRQRKVDALDKESIARYSFLKEEYYHVAYFFSYLEIPADFDEFKNRIDEITQGELSLESKCYADCLTEIRDYLVGVTSKFDTLFGEKLFNDV